MIKARTSVPSNFKSDKNWYSEKEISLIKEAAFNKGFEHFEKSYLKKYTQNILKVQDNASDFFEKANIQCSVTFKQIRLKPISSNSFELIFLMLEDDFSNESTYRKVYQCGLDFISNNIGEDISMTFMYMPFSENLNENEFLLNGFLFTYDPDRTKSEDE